MKATRRYPGSRPFDDSDIERLLFRGRKKEKSDLLNLIMAYDLSLMYARSGTGKTSLLNAGVLHDLRMHEYFPVIVRLNADNPFPSVFEAILSEAKRTDIQVEKVDENSIDLVLLLSKGRFWREDILLTPVVIIDQFEELFTLHEEPAQVEIIKALSNLTARLLADDLEGQFEQVATMPYKIVISIREDYLGDLESLSAAIPTIMHHRFRLNQLSVEQALMAIREPANIENANLSGSAFTYADDAIEMMINFLTRRLEHKNYSQCNSVEPFQLQIICQHIESQVLQRPLEEGPVVINQSDLGGQEGMERILEHFYTDQIERLPEEERVIAHYLCVDGLISPTGKRISLEEEYIETNYAVNPEILKKLVEFRILRAEPRVGSTYYELCHDTLLGAVERGGAVHKHAMRLTQARSSLQEGNFMNALHYYIDAINLNPCEPTAYLECAVMLIDRNQYLDAEEVLAQAERNDVSDAFITVARGRLYLAQEMFPEALKEFKIALADDRVASNKGLSHHCHLSMGLAHLSSGEYSRSVESCRRAIEIDPTHKDAHEILLKAMIYLRQFDLVEQHAIQIHDNEFFIDILQALSQELDKAGAGVISQNILKNTLTAIGNRYDIAIEVTQAAWSIKAWQIALEAIKAANKIKPEIQHFQNQGIALFNLERFEEADTMFSLAIQQDTDDNESILNRAICRTRLKNYDGAIADCQSAVERIPRSARPFKYWGSCLSHQGDHQAAIEKFKQAQQLRPGDSELLFLWAYNLNQLGSFKEAIEMAQKAIDADQTNADAFREMAKSLWFSDQLSEADQKFQTAYALDPNMPDTLVLWGELLGVMKRHGDAIEKFERAHRLDPKDANTLFCWGRSLSDSGRYQASVKKCRQALEHESESADSHHQLALSLANLGDTDTAIDHFNTAIRLAPDDIWIRLSLANTLSNIGRYADAEDQYEQAVNCVTDNETLIAIYDDWGLFLSKMGSHAEAEQTYRKALDIKTNLSLLCRVASQLVRQNRVDEAKILYQNAENLSPEQSTEYGSLGWGFYQLGDYDKSLHYSRRAIELDPDALYVNCNVGLALLRLGRPEEAKNAYEKAVSIAELTTDADEFHFHAITDVEEALEKAPELPGGQDILNSLKKHLGRICKIRSKSNKLRKGP